VTTIEQCTVPSGLIIPDNIPGPDLKPGTLESVAETLRTAGSTAVAHAETAESTWGGLPAVLEAPEGPTIYAALGTPSTTASTIETKFDRVADALDEFAAALGPIKDTFAAITTDAVAFRATIRPDERVWVSSFVMKNDVTHAMYEEARLPGTSPERRLELELLQNAEFAKVPHAPGSADVAPTPGGG
jgi:hypothetical protein